MNLSEVNWKSDLGECACPLEGPKYNEFALVFPGEDVCHVRMCDECGRSFITWMLDNVGRKGAGGE